MRPYQDTENRIIGKLLKTPLESKSMLALANETGLTYVTVHKIIPQLVKKRILRMKKQGKANMISLDFEQAKITKLSVSSYEEKTIFLKKHTEIALLTKEIEEALSGSYYSLILFGSYAKEKAKKNSDIDLLFIVPEKINEQSYKEKIDKVLQLYPKIKKEYKIVSAKEFMEMLSQKHTVGREAFLYGLVLFGAEQYYAMVKDYARTKGY